MDRSNRFTFFVFAGRPVHPDTNSASPGSILRATTNSLTFPPLSIVRYSFIQLSQLGRKCPIFETVALPTTLYSLLQDRCHFGHQILFYLSFPMMYRRRLKTNLYFWQSFPVPQRFHPYLNYRFLTILIMV